MSIQTKKKLDYLLNFFMVVLDLVHFILKGVLSAESSRSVRDLGKGVSGKPYPRLCNARRPRLEPWTFRSQAVRLYRLHQARPSRQTLEGCK